LLNLEPRFQAHGGSEHNNFLTEIWAFLAYQLNYI